MPKHFYFLTIFCLTQTLLSQPINFTALGTGGGGALFAPSISPYDNQELYMVCDMAGVFHSTNSGASWEMYHYDDLTSSTRAKMQFTSDPNILYTVRSRIGTLYRRFPVKSVDGGETWTNLTDPDESLFWYIFADPNHTERLVIGTYNGAWISTDGGDSFSEFYHDDLEEFYLAGAFWDEENIFVASNRGLLVSTDSGQNFNLDNSLGLLANTGFFDFAGSKSDDVIRLYGILTDEFDLYPEVEIYHIDPANVFGLFEMEWGNEIWSEVGGFPANTVPYLVDLPIDNFEAIYTVAQRPDDLPNVYKSTDLGATWTNTFLTENNENINAGYAGEFGDFSWFWAGSAISIDVGYHNSEAVAITDFGFAHITQNGGETWQQMYVNPAYDYPVGAFIPEGQYYTSSGLNQTACHDMLWLSEEELFVAYTDVGNQFSENGGETWTYGRSYIPESNWYKMLKNSANGYLYGAVSDLNDLFLNYRISDDDIDFADGRIVYSQNDGLTWEELHDFNHPVTWMAIDPVNPTTMYASVCHSTEGGIYKTTDLGESWTHLPDPPRTEGHPSNIRILSNGHLVVSFSGRDPNGDDNYTQSSGVFLSSDGGQTWSDRSDLQMQFYTQDVLIDPNNENVWYATVFDHFDEFGFVEYGGLYKTENQGLSWQRIYQFGETHSVGIHPNNSNILYVCNEGGGLYYSQNATSSNPIFTKVENYPYLRPKRVFFNPFNENEVWIVTMGGSVWKGTGDPNATQEIAQNLNHTVAPNPFSEEAIIKFELPNSGRADFKFWNASGKLMHQFSFHFAAGENQVDINRSDLGASGIYFYEIEFGGIVEFGRVVLE